MERPKNYKPLLRLYDIGWRLCIPLLKLSPRLKEGFDERRLVQEPAPADIWIQAASAGEAYLACSLMEHLKPRKPVSILITTNTRQGFDIIRRGIEGIAGNDRQITARASYFPFDRPALMDRAVQAIRPRVMVLLETEIWPGLLYALKRHDCRLLIINGRLTEKSLKRYLLFASFWKAVSPDKILAISEADAKRFGALFGREKVETMPNIKFDCLNPMMTGDDNPLKPLLPDGAALLVLGSVRQEEEGVVENIIRDVLYHVPKTVIGLFPRHMHRLDHWANTLSRMGIEWQYRSTLDTGQVSPGTVILWDCFGELNPAYALARAVFVGGSLAPLGGQNFLEPLIHGVSPVIGPYWDNFFWVGEELIRQGLVCKTNNWQKASANLIKRLKQLQPREAIRKAATGYITARMGGAEQACRAINAALDAES